MTTVTLGAINFGAHLFGTPHVPPWDVSRSVQRFFAVAGEYNLIGQLHARPITMWIELYGYATHLALQTAIDNLGDALMYYGTLTYDRGGGDLKTWTNCIFEGYVPEEEPWLDASGVNGWKQRGKLIFRQVRL